MKQAAIPADGPPDIYDEKHTHFLELEGGKLAYHTSGSGSPVVMLHGLGASSIVWAPVVEAVTRSHTACLVDLPGHGDSDEFQDGHMLPFAVSALERLVDEARCEHATVVGHSLGGLLALAFTLEHPEKVNRLVLVNAAGLSRKPFWGLRLASLPIFGHIYTLLRFILVRLFVDRVVSPSLDIGTWFLEQLRLAQTVQVSGAFIRRVLSSSLDLYGIKDDLYLFPRLEEVHVPTLVIWGDRDPVLPVRTAQRILQRFPEIDVRVFDGVGHMPQLEAPDRFKEALTAFFEEHPLPGEREQRD